MLMYKKIMPDLYYCIKTYSDGKKTHKILKKKCINIILLCVNESKKISNDLREKHIHDIYFGNAASRAFNGVIRFCDSPGMLICKLNSKAGL